MSVKIKYLFSCLLVTIFIFSLVFLSGCSKESLGAVDYFFEKAGGFDPDPETDYQPSEKTKEEIDKAVAEAEEEIEAEKQDKSEAISSDKTPETTVPKIQEETQDTNIKKPTGTVFLIVDFSGVPGEMIIDFDNEAVSGSFNCEDDIGALTCSFEGSIDIYTNTITASGSQTFTGKLSGDIETDSIAIEGILSSDYKSAKGTITNVDGKYPWTATAQ
jgi:hypothetical protein